MSKQSAAQAEHVSKLVKASEKLVSIVSRIGATLASNTLPAQEDVNSLYDAQERVRIALFNLSNSA